MAVTVDLTNMTELYDAESSTGWTSDDTATAYTGWQREGTNCLGCQGSQGTVYAYKTISSVDVSGSHIYAWMFMNGTPDTIANGGYRIIVGDGTNRRAYYVGGSDDLGFQVGAWSCFVLNTASPPSNYATLAGSAAPNFAAVTQIGVQFNIVNKAVGTVDNCFWDICRYGTGLIIKGGGVGTEGTFADIAADDLSTAAGKAYGIIRELQTGVYGVQGAIEFGDDTSTTTTYFGDTNAIVIFEDRAVSSTLYNLSTVGNTTGTNSFVLGELSGTSGIKGCIVKSAGSAKVNIDFDDANVDTMNLYGCSFLDVGTTALPTVDANKNALNCTWDSSGIITASTMNMENCSVISADTDGITISSISMGVTDSTFIDPTSHGVEITTIGTYTFDNMIFSGTDGASNYDIENTTAGLVTINCTNGSNPQYVNNSGGGSTTINNAVNINVYVKDESNTAIAGARVGVYKTSDDTQLILEETAVTTGLATETFNYTSDTDVYVRVRDSSSGTTRYYPGRTTGTITSSGLTLTVVLIEDAIAST